MRVVLAFVFLASAATAQTTYTSTVPDGSTGLWGSETSWSPSGVPGPSDTAVIEGEIQMDSDYIVAELDLRDGALLGDGTLTVSDSAAWTGGRLDGNGFAEGAALRIPSGSVLVIRDGNPKNFRGRDVLVDGRIDWNGSDALTVSAATEIQIGSGGVWDITGDGAITRLNSTLDILIDGTLRRSGAGRTSFEYPFGSFRVNGTLRVEDGTLALTSGSTFASGGTGTLEIVNDGRLFIEGGTYDFSDTQLVGDASGNVEAAGGRLLLGGADFDGSVGTFDGSVEFAAAPEATRIAIGYIFSGTFGGRTTNAGVTVSDTFRWLGGRLGRNATLVIGSDATLETPTPMALLEARSFGGGRLVNQGRVVINLGDDIEIRGSHEIHNEASGEIEIQTDFSLNRLDGFVRVINDGRIVKSFSPGTVEWTSRFGSFWNRGEVEVATGRLIVEGSPPSNQDADSGTWRTMEGTTIEFLGRRYFGQDASLEGEGSFDTSSLLQASAYDHTLHPGLEGIGTFTVLPFPPLSSSGALEIDLNATTCDQVVSPEAVILGGTLRIQYPSTERPLAGTRCRIVQSPQGASGTFDALELPDGLSGLVETDANGAEFVVTAIVDAEETPLAPEALALERPAPNPTSGAVTLRYTLAEAGTVRLAVVDALGREVAVVASGEQPAGEHTVTLDARGLAPGVYVVRLVSGTEARVQRVTVTR
ncbi:MAG: T9SS type A sorting domain-containing protein [Bacteroidota bacterium]